mmetsp:Transcript_7540/g.22028  ORF Transcript_7540/g.22028 Transcript_7540/m.22028 type:complete len:240 (-) Transcript_7540:8-727(-)
MRTTTTSARRCTSRPPRVTFPACACCSARAPTPPVSTAGERRRSPTRFAPATPARLRRCCTPRGPSCSRAARRRRTSSATSRRRGWSSASPPSSRSAQTSTRQTSTVGRRSMWQPPRRTSPPARASSTPARTQSSATGGDAPLSTRRSSRVSPQSLTSPLACPEARHASRSRIWTGPSRPAVAARASRWTAPDDWHLFAAWSVRWRWDVVDAKTCTTRVNQSLFPSAVYPRISVETVHF